MSEFTPRTDNDSLYVDGAIYFPQPFVIPLVYKEPTFSYAKYEAKCDAPSAGAPKVFFKYFYVNTATGEKSGDVLVEGKLSS